MPRAAALFDEAVAVKPAEPLALRPDRDAGASASEGVGRCPGPGGRSPACAGARLLASCWRASDVSEHLSPGARQVPRLLTGPQQPDTAHLLRSALANAYLEGDELGRCTQVLSDMGVPTAGTLVGPFSPWHLLAMDQATGPEKQGSLSALGPGPFGPLTARVVRFADGRISLSGEPSIGDVYLYAADFTVSQAGRYVLRTVTSMDHVATLDGTQVLSRFTTKRPASTLTAKVVDLEEGPTA